MKTFPSCVNSSHSCASLPWFKTLLLAVAFLTDNYNTCISFSFLQTFTRQSRCTVSLPHTHTFFFFPSFFSTVSSSLRSPLCLLLPVALLLPPPLSLSLYPRPPNLASYTLRLTHLPSARQVFVARRQGMSDGLLLRERRLSIMSSWPAGVVRST